MSSNITNFKNIINQNFATIKRKFNNIENNYNSSTSPTTSNNQSISRNVGEIITSSLPLTDAGLHLLDGSLIQGDGINSEFVDYIADTYRNSRTYNPSAFTVVGSPTITSDGVASGFSNNNYITANINTLNATSVRIKHKFKATEVSSPRTIWCTGKYSGVLIQWGYLFIKMSSNGTSNDIFSGGQIPLKVNANTEYWVVYDWDGTTHKIGLSTDDKNYTYHTLGTGTTPIYINGTVYFGKGGTQNSLDANYFAGSLDQKEFSAVINGVDVLNGSTPANYFIDETEWQQSVTQYGVCGKFVYDSTNNTVRLPKITGILEGTTDVSALGNLVEAGLPNITGTFEIAGGWEVTGSGAYSYGTPPSGAFRNIYQSTHYTGTHSGDAESTAAISLDASRSSAIYGNSSTIQPQTIKTFYYIVLATSTKTDIQVNIDEITTDLNDKADTDLANTTPTASFATALNNAGIRTVVETYVNGTSWYRVYSDGWCEQGGRCESSGASYGQTTLLKPYKNTNYAVMFSFNTTLGCRDDMFSVSYVQAYNKTASSFYSYRADSNSNLATMWRACGYV